MKRIAWLLAGVAWVAAVGAGFAVMLRYSSTEGEAGSAPTAWPAGSALARAGDRATLIMFVHPRCPCSRASVAELGRMLQRVGGRAATEVVFVAPEGVPEDWARGGLRDSVSGLPGVTVVDDAGGREARRFGAATSGTTLLYDRDGRLLFAGGITALRGHEGDSFGQERIVALLAHGDADRRESPVFGCALGDGRNADGRQPAP